MGSGTEDKTSLDRLQERYGGPGPRYTSYPSALEFGDQVGPDEYREALVRAGRQVDEPLSVYVHIPFCSTLCLYCGCSVKISRSPERMHRYVDTLGREMELVSGSLDRRRRIAQLHLGGGSPNWLPNEALAALVGSIRDRFELLPDAEMAIELDPRTLEEADLDFLREIGFNRLSLGCQDFTHEVQAAVRRIQPLERTRALFEHARGLGFLSLSIDLMTGLPEQTEAAFARTVEATVRMRPDRISVFPYAHVPWLRPHQRLLERHHLPDAAERRRLDAVVRDRLLDAGYVSIGMDHYAQPDDSLAVAQREGRLHRNFQGYTLGPPMDLVGFGVTSISDVADAYAQNAPAGKEWEGAIESGVLPTVRGFVLDADDRIRRVLIRQLLCDFSLDMRAFERLHGIRFAEQFAEALGALEPLEADGLVQVSSDRIDVTEVGRPFVRAVAMAFDAHSARRLAQSRPAFSRIS